MARLRRVPEADGSTDPSGRARAHLSERSWGRGQGAEPTPGGGGRCELYHSNLAQGRSRLAGPVTRPNLSVTFFETINRLAQYSRSPKEFNMSKLSNKAALVTGGSRGIGAAIARRLAAEGASVAITYTKGADAAASVVKEIGRAGGRAIAIQADAADADASKAAVEKTVEAFGRLDVLVNNAGTAIPKRFEETTLEELDRLIDVNVRGTLVATQAALKHMKNGGRILII